MRNACARHACAPSQHCQTSLASGFGISAQQSECPRKHTQIGLIFVYGKTGAGGGQIRCCRRVFLITSAACQSWPKDDWPRWQISAAASAPLSRPAIGVGVEVVCRRCTHTSTQTGMLMRTQMSTQTPGRLPGKYMCFHKMRMFNSRVCVYAAHTGGNRYITSMGHIDMDRAPGAQDEIRSPRAASPTGRLST